MQNSSPDPHQQANNNPVMRPGVSEACLTRNGWRHVLAEEADALVGCHHPGVLIPYFAYQNSRWEPVCDPETKPYFRLRKAGVEGSGKYHQPPNTAVHSYVPAELDRCSYNEVFGIGEGEAKALSISDFSQGFSVPAAGTSGFYGYRVKKLEGDPNHLTAECEWALNANKTPVIAFLGDADTCCNWQFSDAAVGFRELVAGRKIILPRLPIGGPKGIDDCRQELGAGFEKFCRRILDDAIELNVGMEADQLALVLLERELPAISKLSADQKAVITHKIVKMAAVMSGEAR